MRNHLFIATLLILAGAFQVFGQNPREVGGIIYFTNNTPDDLRSFPVQIVTRKRKKVVASTTPDQHYEFHFRGVKADKYLLKLTWPRHCVLWYRLDLRKESKTQVRVIMDVACAHVNGKISDLPQG
ncbi:MAG TPA: hypothetical protein VNG71_01555 [Pyrinomonadaceae bacterium]|nr:hypothetical protein [Pyrinomonadaceae bacterium]